MVGGRGWSRKKSWIVLSVTIAMLVSLSSPAAADGSAAARGLLHPSQRDGKAGRSMAEVRTFAASSSGPLGGLQYQPLTPARLLDTRGGTGGISGGLGPSASVAVQVAGRAGVPSVANAAVINVTVVNTSYSSWLAVYPDGTSFGGTSTINWIAGDIRANMAIVPLGADGAIRLLNLAGWTDVVIDVEGYFAQPALGDTSGLYRPLTPARVLDTRSGMGGLTTLGQQQIVSFQVAGHGNVPSTGVAAVILNVTATNPTFGTFVSAFPAGMPFQGTSTVNLTPGQTTPNRVIVKLGAGGAVSLYNNTGSVDVVADVAGWFTDASDPAASGGTFHTVTPFRVLDTRTGTPFGTIPANVPEPFQVAGMGGLPASGVSGVALNVTETSPSDPGWLAVFPDGNWLPLASDLNFAQGETHANATVVKVGANGRAVLDTLVGTVDVVADVSGWFSSAPVPGPPPSAPGSAQAAANSPFSVALNWTSPASTGGSQLVNYTISSLPNDGLWAMPPSATAVVLGGLRCGVSYSFWVTASNGAGTGPAAGPINAATSCSHTIGNVTYYRQVYVQSCEEASLQMALSHEGISPTQAQELNDIGIDYRTGYYSGGVVRWSDPYAVFVGDPNGSQVALTGYGTYYTTIERIAFRYGAAVMRAGEGVPAQDVYTAVLNDHPVVAWVTFDWQYHGPQPWLTFDGNWVQYHGPIEHAVTIVGVTPTDVYVYNPWFGPQWVSKSTFEAAYSTYNSMAVIVW